MGIIKVKQTQGYFYVPKCKSGFVNRQQWYQRYHGGYVYLHEAQEVERAAGCMTYTVCEKDITKEMQTVTDTLEIILKAIGHLEHASVHQESPDADPFTHPEEKKPLRERAREIEQWVEHHERVENFRNEKHKEEEEQQTHRYHIFLVTISYIVLAIFVAAAAFAAYWFFPDQTQRITLMAMQKLTRYFYICAGEASRYSRKFRRAYREFSTNDGAEPYLATPTRDVGGTGGERGDASVPLMHMEDGPGSSSKDQ